MEDREEISRQKVGGTVFQTEGTAGVMEHGSDGPQEPEKAQIDHLNREPPLYLSLAFGTSAVQVQGAH